MIDHPHPTNWRSLQAGVCRLLNEIGLTAEIEVPLKTPRGSVVVDIYAIDNQSVDKIQYIVECKNWSENIPQSVVHSFTSVMHETGANIGFIVSRYGLQSGAIQYMTNTNIQGMTYEELQQRYFNVWWQKYFCTAVRSAADSVTQYVEPFNSRRERFLSGLSPDSLMRFRRLQTRYADFGMLMWLIHMDDNYPVHIKNPAFDINIYKNKLNKLLRGEFTFRSLYFRDLLNEVNEYFLEIESMFNSIFGENIFRIEG